MRSLRSIALSGLLILPMSAPAVAQQAAQGQATSLFETRLFPLQFMSNQDAASLIAPFVQVDGRFGVFEAGAAVRGITVRASKDILTRVDSLLKAYDRAPASTVLRFQLIAALDSTVKDPAIPANVDATLRDLFKFGGYRLLAQGSAAVGSSNFEVTMSAGADRYTISGTMGNARGSAGRGGRGSPPPPSSSASSVELSVNLMGSVENQMPAGRTVTWQTLFSTGLAVPMGETVVLGSAAASGGRRALILTVRPELLSGGR